MGGWGVKIEGSTDHSCGYSYRDVCIEAGKCLSRVLKPSNENRLIGRVRVRECMGRREAICMCWVDEGI